MKKVVADCPAGSWYVLPRLVELLLALPLAPLATLTSGLPPNVGPYDG